MKRIIVALLMIAGAAKAQPDYEKLADAIYRIEGGANTRFPYGITSITTTNARQVCITTCRNNYARWVKAGKHGSYLDFLADRYCPPTADKIGNARWKKNVRAIYKGATK